jgi:hypothetical protein
METHKKHRHLFITMICSFYFIYWAINFLGLIATLLMRIGSDFPPITNIFNQINMTLLGSQVNVSLVTWLVAIGLVAGIVGYWLSQKWAVIVYAAASVALFIVTLPPLSVASTNLEYAMIIIYSIASIYAINIALIVLGIINFKKMK